jgi:hypothetical protein
MSKSALRCRLLPLNAWRAILLAAAMAMPLRHGFEALAAAEAKPSASPAATATPASKKKPGSAKKDGGKKEGKKKSDSKKGETKKVTAAQLIGEIEKGLALMGKGAKDAKLDPKSKTAAPFFTSAKAVATGVATLKKQLAAKDPAYFKTLGQTADAVGKLRVATPRAGVSNKSINDGAKIVFDSFDALRGGFGKEAARRKQGGPLTDKEKAAFAQLKEQQKSLVAKLAPLQAKAAKEGNKRLASDLTGLIKQSKRISASSNTLAGFLAALELADTLMGEYSGYTYYVPTTYRTEWTTITPILKSSETTYWEYYDSYPVTDWSYYETSSISYSYDYSWEASISESEVSEYDSYLEDTSTEELSDDTYIDDDSYDESLEQNEDQEDDTWSDTEEDVEDSADDDSGDDSDDSDDDSDDSDDDSDDSGDDSDDSDDDSDDSDDDSDDSDDDSDDSGDDSDDSGDDSDDSGDDSDDSDDDSDDSDDDSDDSGDDSDDSDDDSDDSDDDGGDDDGGDDDSGGDE